MHHLLFWRGVQHILSTLNICNTNAIIQIVAKWLKTFYVPERYHLLKRKLSALRRLSAFKYYLTLKRQRFSCEWSPVRGWKGDINLVVLSYQIILDFKKSNGSLFIAACARDTWFTPGVTAISAAVSPHFSSVTYAPGLWEVVVKRFWCSACSNMFVMGETPQFCLKLQKRIPSKIFLYLSYNL